MEELWVTSFRCCYRNRYVKHRGTSPRNLQTNSYHSGYATLTTLLQPYTKTKSTIFTNASTGKTPAYSLLRRSRKMEKYFFLDCLVTRDDNKRRKTIYRKPTHTYRLRDQSSYNSTSHKATTIRTLTRRVPLVCDSPDSLTDKIKDLDNVFNKNNYNPDFITRNTYRISEPNVTNPNSTLVSTATLPYIKGTFETIARILQPYNICVAHKPITTLLQLQTNVKDKDEPSDRQGAVYKVKCCDCQATYIGETGRNLNIPLTEHKRAT